MRFPSIVPPAAHSLNLPESEEVAAAAATLEQTVEKRSSRNASAESPAAQDRREGAITGVRIGQIAALAEGGTPLVDFPGNPAGAAVAAKTTTRLAPQDLRRSVVLMFEDGSPRRPVILGLLEQTPIASDETLPLAGDATPRDPRTALDLERFTVEADGRRVTVTADQELVLRCGKASITLTKAGKVIVRGAYLLSRSSGVNRIKGGSVQIN
jgi:hypothetical protein